MTDLNQWGSVTVAGFDFGPGGGEFQGGAAHNAAGELAFFAPGRLPVGWTKGTPAPVGLERWEKMAAEHYRTLTHG